MDRLLYDDDKHLTRAETTGVIDNLLKEVDNDEDGAICFPEFQQAMQKVIRNIALISLTIVITFTNPYYRLFTIRFQCFITIDFQCPDFMCNFKMYLSWRKDTNYNRTTAKWKTN